MNNLNILFGCAASKIIFYRSAKNKYLMLSPKPSVSYFLFLTCMQDCALAEPRCLRCLTFVFLRLEKLAFYIRLSAKLYEMVP